MTPDIAKAALQFLLRVDLKGAEVPAFITVVNAIEAFAAPPPAPKVEAP